MNLKKALIFLGMFGLFQSNVFANEKPVVMASFSILADVVEKIGGDKVDVISIVPPGTNPHSYQMTPNDIKNLKGAKLFVLNGLGLEGWQEKMIEASSFTGQTLYVNEGNDQLLYTDTKHVHHDEHAGHDHDEHAGHDHDEHAGHDHDEHAGHDHDEHAGHDHDEHAGHDHDEHAGHDQDKHTGHDGRYVDPHVWQNPENVMLWTALIKEALIELDPQHAEIFEKNAQDYQEQLQALDQWIKNEVKQVPVDERKILMSHDAFAYLSDQYQISVYPLKGVNPQASESAAEIKDLIQLIQSEHIKVAFYENIEVDRMIQVLQKDYDLKIGGTLYSDGLTGKDGPASDYIALMKTNIQTIVDALK